MAARFGQQNGANECGAARRDEQLATRGGAQVDQSKETRRAGRIARRAIESDERATTGRVFQAQQEQQELALVQELGSQASGVGEADGQAGGSGEIGVEGNRLVTTISTIAAQSSESRIVLALLKDGTKLELKVQEMQPAMFEVGANLAQSRKYCDEHRKLVANLKKQKDAPLESWMAKYREASSLEANMSDELRLIYLCMAENLQACWRALLLQLEQRLQLLESTCNFYGQREQLLSALDQADTHVQVFRQHFLAGVNSAHFAEASAKLTHLNQQIANHFLAAKTRQAQLVKLIGTIASSNSADARQNVLLAEAQALIDYIRAQLDPLERRKIQLENVITSSRRASELERTNGIELTGRDADEEPSYQGKGAPRRRQNRSVAAESSRSTHTTTTTTTSMTNGFKQTRGPGGIVREISNFNDLNLVENWLNVKIEQLNSSLLSSLGVGAQDTRSILNKHEQIALECSAIEGATLKFDGKHIHALRMHGEGADAGQPGEKGAEAEAPEREKKRRRRQLLFEQQRQLANKARDVITILEARVVLLRRAIDFYARARDASADINKLMRRLQLDNSLQSVQFVADQLELKDVSSVVASGATILSELQQLQLAQQHGQRSKLINLNLATSGVRAIIDQLNQDLAHLKTVLAQRRLVLLNEDSSKMAQNFSNKCHQLKFWLDNQAKSFLLENGRLGFEVGAVRAYCEAHEHLQSAMRHKTLEVEALLRLLATLAKNFEAEDERAAEIQRDTDELRLDWINVTNCLEGRLEFARKYLAILRAFAQLGADLDRLASSLSLDGRPTSGGDDERTVEEIRSSINEALERMAREVQQFSNQAPAVNTALAHIRPLESKWSSCDINKQQIVAHANGALKLLSERNKSTISKLIARGPRKWPHDTETETEGAAGRQAEAPARSQTRRRRGSVQMAPRFSRQLQDLELEPFSSAELECELDPASTVNLAGNLTHQIKVEWLLNDKRIPANIKHSVSSEANRHRLTIKQFGPTCCGKYTALATNQLTGESASSSCRLRLAGIRELDDAAAKPADADRPQFQPTARHAPGQQVASSPAGSATSSFSAWRSVGNSKWRQESQTGKQEALERIIRGVESAEPDERPNQEAPSAAPTSTTATATATIDNTTTTTTTTKSTTSSSSTSKLKTKSASDTDGLPVTQLAYSGQQQQRDSRLNFIDSPSAACCSSADSRQVSQSPFAGTPQPPVFVSGLSDSLAHLDNRAGLVCVVMGNPPPQVEWLHEGKAIASARCARPADSARANVCKLTIETVNQATRGHYVCRATNRMGQTSTTLALAK